MAPQSGVGLRAEAPGHKVLSSQFGRVAVPLDLVGISGRLPASLIFAVQHSFAEHYCVAEVQIIC
jgi:hypothetical protein